MEYSPAENAWVPIDAEGEKNKSSPGGLDLFIALAERTGTGI